MIALSRNKNVKFCFETQLNERRLTSGPAAVYISKNGTARYFYVFTDKSWIYFAPKTLRSASRKSRFDTQLPALIRRVVTKIGEISVESGSVISF